MAWNEPDAIGYTARVVVPPVLLSVMVAVPEVAPVVSVRVTDVSEMTEIPEIDKPPIPDAANSVEAVSWVQTVLTPVIVNEVPCDASTPSVDTASVVAATGICPSVTPSEIVRVPVPLPVVTTTVADVVEVIVWLTLVTPETPESEKTVVPLDQLVPAPVSVRVMWPACPAGMPAGLDVIVTGLAATWVDDELVPSLIDI